MILRKPYAFFIKIFKPLHIFLALMLAYLIYIENSLLKIFNNYIHYSTLTSNYISSNFIYIIPIIIISVYALILGIMYKKNKPFRFYLVGIIFFIIIIVINIYASSYASIISNQAVPIKTIKFVSDLVLIDIVIEVLSFVLLIIRGFGVDIKKFDFSSDLLNIDISDNDREEFEVNINLDIDLKKRQRRKRINEIKYAYKENKFKINVAIFVVIIFFVGFITFFKNSFETIKDMNYTYLSSDLSFKINSSYIVNQSQEGRDIDNVLVIDISMKSDNNKSFNLGDFSVILSQNKIKPTNKYNELLSDLGIVYSENKLSNVYKNYLLVFELPQNYVEGNKIFEYSKLIKVKLKESKLHNDTFTVRANLGDSIIFNNLNNIEVKISEYDIQNQYVVNYNYCYRENECVPSIEYLRPSIDENFDKAILRLNLEFKSENNEAVTDFYSLLKNYGYIRYEIGSETYMQKGDFEEIKSNKKKMQYTYIGVNKNILQAEHIAFVFNVRNSIYEYILK